MQELSTFDNRSVPGVSPRALQMAHAVACLLIDPQLFVVGWTDIKLRWRTIRLKHDVSSHVVFSWSTCCVQCFFLLLQVHRKSLH